MPPVSGMIELASETRAAGPTMKPVLLVPCAAAQDQNNDSDDSQHTANDLDDLCTVQTAHVGFPFLQQNVCCAPRLERNPSNTRRQKTAKPPARKTANR